MTNTSRSHTSHSPSLAALLRGALPQGATASSELNPARRARRIHRSGVALALALIVGGCLLPAGSVFANTLTVNSLADNTIAGDGLVTLREAVIAANNDTTDDLGQTGSGDDTIVFDPSIVPSADSVYSSTHSIYGGAVLDLNSPLPLASNIDIEGPGKNLYRDEGPTSPLHWFPGPTTT